jgi:shikimate 5-dehydrogenase
MRGFIKIDRAMFYTQPRLSPVETNILLFVGDTLFTMHGADSVSLTYEELCIGAGAARRSIVTALKKLADRGFIHKRTKGRFVEVQILHLEQNLEVINLHLERNLEVQINHLDTLTPLKESKYKKKSQLIFKNSDYEPGGKYHHLVFNRQQA